MKTMSLIIMMAGINAFSASCALFNKGNTRYSSTPNDARRSSSPVFKDSAELMRSSLRFEMSQAVKYAEENGYSTEYFFLINMAIPSGKNRFFVYNHKDDRVELSGLVSHGNCNSHNLGEVRFSNTPNCGCSSVGKYKVGPSYHGEFGKAYRLFGLDSSNSNAFKRGIVLHGFDPVPDHEIYPESLCNSFGCPMVNRSFLDKLSGIIDKSQKPILLWIFE